MSNDSERSPDEIAEELAEKGEATITVELAEKVSPSEVEITLRE